MDNSILDSTDFINIIVTKEEVETNDTKDVLSTLKQLLVSPEYALKFQESVDISFHGYDNYREELWEIPEVRNYIYQLDEAFPYWLYFLTKHSGGLWCIIHSFLLPFLKKEADKRINAQRLENYLMNRGLPALYQMCQFTGIDVKDFEIQSKKVLEYLEKGPFKL